MASDTYSDVISMAVILLGIIVLFGVLWLLVRKCGLGPPAVVEPRGEEAPGGVDQPQKAASVSPGGAAGNAVLDEPQVKMSHDLLTPDVVSSPGTCGTLSPSQRIVKVARRASVAVSRAVKQETGAILEALSSGADVMQVPTENASESEGPAKSCKEGNAKSTKGAAVSDKEGRTEDTKPKTRGSLPSKFSPPGQTSAKQDDVGDVTVEKPTQSKDARNETCVKVEIKDGAAQQGQPPPTESHVGSSMDDATVNANAKEQSPQEDNNNAGPGSGAAVVQLSHSQDADVVTSAEHRFTKGESRQKTSKKRSSTAAGSVNQSLVQSEVKNDPGSRHSKRKRKSSSRSANKTQP